MSSNIVITKDGVTVQDGRITVNIGSSNGTSSFTIENVNRTDSGSYTVNVSTTANVTTTVNATTTVNVNTTVNATTTVNVTTTVGSDTAVVNLDVYCELVFFVFYIKSIQYIFLF